MLSHSTLPEARKNSIRATIDETLTKVKEGVDLAALDECRSLFRKQVPLHLRSYVAAALLLEISSSSKQGYLKSDSRRFSDSRTLPNYVRSGRASSAKTSFKEAEKPESRFQGEGSTLFISAGRRQRFYSRIVRKMLVEVEGVSDSSIGDIRTMDNYSFVVVDPTVEEKIITSLNGKEFKGRPLAVNKARKKSIEAENTQEQEA